MDVGTGCVVVVVTPGVGLVATVDVGVDVDVATVPSASAFGSSLSSSSAGPRTVPSGLVPSAPLPSTPSPPAPSLPASPEPLPAPDAPSSAALASEPSSDWSSAGVSVPWSSSSAGTMIVDDTGRGTSMFTTSSTSATTRCTGSGRLPVLARPTLAPAAAAPAQPNRPIAPITAPMRRRSRPLRASAAIDDATASETRFSIITASAPNGTSSARCAASRRWSRRFSGQTRLAPKIGKATASSAPNIDVVTMGHLRRAGRSPEVLSTWRTHG